MIRVFFITILLTATLVACKNDKSSTVKTTTDTTVVDEHSPKVSLDWNGSYYGIAICANCPDSEIVLRLQEDNSYLKTTITRDQEAKVSETSGTATWSSDGSTITVSDLTYLVAEGQLFPKAKEDDTDRAPRLSKISTSANAESTQVERFVDQSDRWYQVKYITNTKTPLMIINTDQSSDVLFQTEAWAKGGEYLGAQSKATAKGDKITLTLNGQTVELTKRS